MPPFEQSMSSSKTPIFNTTKKLRHCTSRGRKIYCQGIQWIVVQCIIQDFPTKKFSFFVDHHKRMVDPLGVDHQFIWRKRQAGIY